jgi:hypothetical protein
MFALSRSQEEANQIATAMKKAFTRYEIDNIDYVSKVNGQGPRVI